MSQKFEGGGGENREEKEGKREASSRGSARALGGEGKSGERGGFVFYREGGGTVGGRRWV
jgi:hypothetical protein